jgi:hypothetical protein
MQHFHGVNQTCIVFFLLSTSIPFPSECPACSLLHDMSSEGIFLPLIDQEDPVNQPCTSVCVWINTRNFRWLWDGKDIEKNRNVD